MKVVVTIFEDEADKEGKQFIAEEKNGQMAIAQTLETLAKILVELQKAQQA